MGGVDFSERKLLAFLSLLTPTDDDHGLTYDRQSHIGKLDKGLDEARAKGWAVVDMKND